LNPVTDHTLDFLVNSRLVAKETRMGSMLQKAAGKKGKKEKKHRQQRIKE
jgi:hypothetical protein